MKTNELENRRAFLKKVAYSAPVLVGLGTLALPQDANAIRFHHSGHGHSCTVEIEGRFNYHGHTFYFKERPDGAASSIGETAFGGQQTPFGGSIRR